MIAAPALPEHVFFVVRNLRDVNRREMAAQELADADALAVSLLAQPDRLALMVLATDEAQPVAVLGAWLERPGIAVVQLLATDQWPAIGRAAVRWMARKFMPRVLVPQVRVARTHVLADGPDRRWLRLLGFAESSLVLPIGVNGERFVEVAWVNN